LTGSGDLALADGKGAFTFKADKLAIIQRANRWLMLSGEVTATTAWDAVSLAGKLRADAGYFELAGAAPPRLSDDVIVRGRVATTEKPVRFNIDVDVDLGNQLYFNGRGLNTRLAGDLRLRAEPKSALRVLGSVSASSGTFDAYGQYLTIERGILNFQGPIETAGLNVLALHKGLAVEAGVEISGTVADPRVRLVSEPNVPDTEKLSWIVVGRGQDQAGSSDSALLLSAATAILGGSSDSLPRQIAQGLGFDQLTVSSGSLGGNQSSLPTTTAAGSTTSSAGGPNSPANLSSQIVTLGKRLSANAYVSYEQSLAGASSVVKLTYNLSRRVSVIGRAGTDNSIDLSYTFSFD
jgi:translocation and assembly module TamB